ncbi:MAG: SDR family oxidoreductase [Anaerolineae bacterium]|nr:SDR family oxidoreductase [Anaerolineae bacterium]
MKSIVITGSTRGIGLGLAHEFLVRGCAVTVSGRSQASVDKAVATLSAKHGDDRLLGQPCDVGQFDQVQALWDAAQTRFGKVDIWINNAGLGNVMLPLWELPAERLQAIVDTNLTGMMYACKVAITGMIEQGYGQIYNMEGHGSNGSIRNGLTPYGTTKYAVRYLTKALLKETANTPVQIGFLSPGIVITDLLNDGYANRGPEETARTQRIFNILGDRVETVTPYLVEKVLANEKAGTLIEWLTYPKIISRFLLARFRKRDLFNDNHQTF